RQAPQALGGVVGGRGDVRDGNGAHAPSGRFEGMVVRTAIRVAGPRDGRAGGKGGTGDRGGHRIDKPAGRLAGRGGRRRRLLPPVRRPRGPRSGSPRESPPSSP